MDNTDGGAEDDDDVDGRISIMSIVMKTARIVITVTGCIMYTYQLNGVVISVTGCIKYTYQLNGVVITVTGCIMYTYQFNGVVITVSGCIMYTYQLNGVVIGDVNVYVDWIGTYR